MKIYTRTGDDGSTGLGSRQRIGKDSLRIDTYGTVDELNSVLGVALATDLFEPLPGVLERVQEELFHLGSDLCVPDEDKERWPVPQMEEQHISALEVLMDELDGSLQPLKNFVLPGGSLGAAQLHVARTVARRCERLLVSLARVESVNPIAMRYLNRLSDALFMMARYENYKRGVADVVWKR